MISLSDEQKNAIGLSFVLGKLQGDSPFGEALIRKAGFYKKEQKRELLDEFDNIAHILTYIERSEDGLDKLRRILMGFKSIENILKKLEHSYLHEIEFFELKSFMLSLAKLMTEFSQISLSLTGIEFKDMEVALNILDPDKKRVAPFYLNERYTKDLWDIRNEKNRIEALIRAAADNEALDKLKLERGVIAAREEEAETFVKKDLSEKLKPFLPVFLENITAIGRLDFTIQKTLLAKAYGAVCPEIAAGEGAVRFSHMRNPQAEAVLAERGKGFTPLSIELKVGTTLISGANMGGKTVAIKTAVLNVCLCHMGFFVFAAEAKIPLFDGVHLIAEDTQSISSGLSTFGGEVVRFNNIVQRAKSEYLFVALDEFARGTNPEEGAMIVRAVSRYLNKLKLVAVLSTHYDNVAEEGFGLYQVAGLKNLDFEKLSGEPANGREPASKVDLISAHMDYRLLPVQGSLKSPRDALNICKLLGTPQEVVDAIEEEYGLRACVQ